MATSNFKKALDTTRRLADEQDARSQERIARQHDTITNLMGYLEELGKVPAFIKWQEKNGTTTNLDNWKKAHPNAGK